MYTLFKLSACANIITDSVCLFHNLKTYEQTTGVPINKSSTGFVHQVLEVFKYLFL